MKLSKLYKQSVIYPALLLFPLSAIFSVIQFWNYKGGYLDSREMIVAHILISIVYSLWICLLSLTIFLIRINQIRSNRFLSFLSWFALPCSFMSLVIGKGINEWVTIGSIWEIIYGLFINTPFIVGLILGYIQFKKSVLWYNSH